MWRRRQLHQPRPACDIHAQAPPAPPPPPDRGAAAGAAEPEDAEGAAWGGVAGKPLLGAKRPRGGDGCSRGCYSAAALPKDAAANADDDDDESLLALPDRRDLLEMPHGAPRPRRPPPPSRGDCAAVGGGGAVVRYSVAVAAIARAQAAAVASS